MEVGEGRAADGATRGAAGPPPSTEAVEVPRASEADVIAKSRHERDRSMVAHGRRLAGTPGAIMAGAMIALRDIYEAPRDERIVATAESPTEPVDVDTDGVHLPRAELSGPDDLHVPAQPRRAPIVPGRRRARRR
jgi:hypothetical protein